MKLADVLDLLTTFTDKCCTQFVLLCQPHMVIVLKNPFHCLLLQPQIPFWVMLRRPVTHWLQIPSEGK